MSSYKVKTKAVVRTIESLVHDYFKGLHYGEVEMLEPLFSEDCVLKAPGVRRTREEWLNLVKNRPIPASRGDKFGSQILSIEVLGEQAMVKTYVPLLGNEFIDYLGLLKENGSWMIVNKMYADKSDLI